jgi:hypothetical protein
VKIVFAFLFLGFSTAFADQRVDFQISFTEGKCTPNGSVCNLPSEVFKPISLKLTAQNSSTMESGLHSELIQLKDRLLTLLIAVSQDPVKKSEYYFSVDVIDDQMGKGHIQFGGNLHVRHVDEITETRFRGQGFTLDGVPYMPWVTIKGI